MNTLKITFTSFLLLAAASVTQFASATGVQTPDFLNVVASANNAVHNMHGEDCEDRAPAEARIWDAKLVDRNGDGTPDEDRFRSAYPYMGRLNNEAGGRVASAFVVGRKHMVTVAHALSVDGVPAHGHDTMFIQVEACGSQRYEIVNRELGTTAPQRNQNAHLDYAVIELDRELCPEANQVVFGVPEGLDEPTTDLIASGYYSPETIGNTTSRVASLRPETSDPDASPFVDYIQFSSSGNIIDSRVVSGQRVDFYEMGQEIGGSGGPIVSNINGQHVAVGMQFRQPNSSSKNYNLSLATEGPFRAFVEAYVPDLVEFRPGQEI